MCDFCDAIDANGLKYKAVVLEYIYMDLNKDEMSFSVPAYQKIYQKALSLLPEFKTESEKKAVELEQTKKNWNAKRSNGSEPNSTISTTYAKPKIP